MEEEGGFLEVGISTSSSSARTQIFRRRIPHLLGDERAASLHGPQHCCCSNPHSTASGEQTSCVVCRVFTSHWQQAGDSDMGLGHGCYEEGDGYSQEPLEGEGQRVRHYKLEKQTTFRTNGRRHAQTSKSTDFKKQSRPWGDVVWRLAFPHGQKSATLTVPVNILRYFLALKALAHVLRWPDKRKIKGRE